MGSLSILFAITLLIIVVGVCVLDMTAGSYRDYGFFAIPAFAFLLWFAAFVRRRETAPQIIYSKIIRYTNKFAYEFFLAQFFCFNITKKIADVMSLKDGAVLTVIALVICITISVVLHEFVTRPGKKILLKVQKIWFWKN